MFKDFLFLLPKKFMVMTGGISGKHLVRQARLPNPDVAAIIVSGYSHVPPISPDDLLTRFVPNLVTIQNLPRKSIFFLQINE